MKKLLIIAALLMSLIFILSCQTTAGETEQTDKKTEDIAQEQPQLQVDKPEVYLTDQNSAIAQGYVRNTGNVTAYSITAEATFYDKTGAILDTGEDYIDKLEVGDQWKWDVKYRGPATVGLPEAKVSVTYYASDQKIDRPIITYN
ncbi:MAG: hypothetical protein JSU79_07095 [Dehalococcoidales bacterium]|nr:MAG: hypothetical protein JSU79_07095 [Dehalococcoidales bacterium]